MEILVLTSIILLSIGFTIKQINKYKELGIDLTENNGFKFLLVWILLGFVTNVGNSDDWGCVITVQPIFTFRNVLFSVISFGLIFLAFKAQNAKTEILFCMLELVYWVSKLIIFKGGYVVGFTGSPDETVVFYDLIAVSARLFILSKLLEVNRFRFIKIGVIALMILTVKILCFATPLKMIYEEREAIEAGKLARKELIGTWNGKVKKQKSEEILFEKVVNIQIDSLHLYLDSIVGMENIYQLRMNNLKYGILSKNGKYHNYGLSIQKLDQDSLIMVFDNILERYKFELERD